MSWNKGHSHYFMCKHFCLEDRTQCLGVLVMCMTAFRSALDTSAQMLSPPGERAWGGRGLSQSSSGLQFLLTGKKLGSYLWSPWDSLITMHLGSSGLFSYPGLCWFCQDPAVLLLMEVFLPGLPLLASLEVFLQQPSSWHVTPSVGCVGACFSNSVPVSQNIWFTPIPFWQKILPTFT